MKKIITLFCTLTLGIYSAYGVTLCKKTNTAVALMNKTVAGTKESAENSRWVVNMADGTVVKGKSLCTGMPGDFAVVNTGVADTYDTGVNCYCKMMAPATSYWVNASGTTPYTCESGCENACESKCADLCADYMAGNETFRSAVYEAVW
ncbi:MAG: hypothetical protein IKN73_04390 [Alphaproteobacteria bacterium]|nr:hypothetical protein [Alphaproteobacteria bacterium]